MNDFSFFEVGGCVRDMLLGIPSKDIDFTVVANKQFKDAKEAFAALQTYLVDRGYTIFLVTESCFTIRGKFPLNHDRYAGEAADFVLARKETYNQTSRVPNTSLGH